jgi:hypothetical protein
MPAIASDHQVRPDLDIGFSGSSDHSDYAPVLAHQADRLVPHSKLEFGKPLRALGKEA